MSWWYFCLRVAFAFCFEVDSFKRIQIFKQIRLFLEWVFYHLGSFLCELDLNFVLVFVYLLLIVYCVLLLNLFKPVFLQNVVLYHFLFRLVLVLLSFFVLFLLNLQLKNFTFLFLVNRQLNFLQKHFLSVLIVLNCQ